MLISPGLISISSPIFNTPFIILPPTIPPFIFSISSPGLFTSNDLFLKMLPYDNKLWTISQFSNRSRDIFGNVLAHCVNVIVKLGGNGNDRRVFSPGPLYESLDLLQILLRGISISKYKINFVLHNYYLV